MGVRKALEVICLCGEGRRMLQAQGTERFKQGDEEGEVGDLRLGLHRDQIVETGFGT